MPCLRRDDYLLLMLLDIEYAAEKECFIDAEARCASVTMMRVMLFC